MRERRACERNLTSDWRWGPEGALARGEETGAMRITSNERPTTCVPRAPTVECVSARRSPRQSLTPPTSSVLQEPRWETVLESLPGCAESGFPDWDGC